MVAYETSSVFYYRTTSDTTLLQLTDQEDERDAAASRG